MSAVLDWLRETDQRLNAWGSRHQGPWWATPVIAVSMWTALLGLLAATEGRALRGSTPLMLGIGISVPAAYKASRRARSMERQSQHP